MPDTPPAEPTFRDIDGRRCTDRPGIAILAGLTGGRAIDVRAGRDPDFPAPLDKIGRTWWYPLDGDHGVNAYLEALDRRGEAGKPPPVEDGDPTELLGPDAAAAALRIARSTFDYYVSISRPHWEAADAGEPLPGHPQLPTPDTETPQVNNLGPYIAREWYRDTLARHQHHQRPGTSVNRGRTKQA